MPLNDTTAASVRRQLEDLVDHMLRRSSALKESLAEGDQTAGSSAAIAGELLRCNCLARALVAHVRRASSSDERKRCVASMLALLSGAMVDDDVLEEVIAAGRAPTAAAHDSRSRALLLD